ncbi:MAG TPA: polysaccharide biosynthesis tyrosine autokinase [Acidobacteriaceae bacterium]|nr:polysaccharide biosynthesis tyrosine autokinase [Acidobacteriaceae bacterium]
MQQLIRSKQVSAAPEARDLSLTDLWLVIRKRRVLLVCLALGAGLLAAGMGYARGRWYTATGEVRVQPDTGSEFKQSISAALGSSSSLDVVIESDIRILQSTKLLTSVAEKLDLANNPVFMNGGQRSLTPAFFRARRAAIPHRSLDDPLVRDAVVGNLRGHLTAVRVPRTQMLTISYTSPSAKLSAQIVNALENEFIENNFSTHFNTTQQVSKWLTGQMDDLRTVVQNSQNKMVDLQRKLGVMALDPDHSLLVQEIGALQKNLSDATEERVIAEARYRILKSLPPDQVQESSVAPGVAGGVGGSMGAPQGLLASLRSQRASNEADLARLQPVYGPNYPQVKQLRAQEDALNKEIGEQEQRVVEQANDTLSMAEAAETKAQGLLDERIHEVYGQRDDLVQYMLLSQEYDSNRKMYESIVGRLREATVDAGLDAADISVVDFASVPLGPSSSSPMKLGIVGMFFGFFGGLTLALLLEKMDTRLRDVHEIQEILGLPSLAMIPQSHWKSRASELEWVAGPELLRDPRSPFSESFRALRTSMRLSTTSRESKVIAVTSCQPAEGKSTVSVNMAAVLAQGGKKVALVDTDMRRPSVYKRLRLEGGKGLSEVLTGYYTLDEVTQTHETLTTLDVIPSGTVPPLPADLLASDQMTEVVRQLREHYDYVIFDTPPLLSVTDPAIVASQADGMVLVIRQGYCTRRMLARAAEILHELDVKVYGFVFNGVDASLPEYYGYLGYYTYEYGK